MSESVSVSECVCECVCACGRGSGWEKWASERRVPFDEYIFIDVSINNVFHFSNKCRLFSQLLFIIRSKPAFQCTITNAHSISHSLTHPLSHPPTHSPTHPLTHPPTHQRTHTHTGHCACSPVVRGIFSPRFFPISLQDVDSSNDSLAQRGSPCLHVYTWPISPFISYASVVIFSPMV